MRGDCDDDEERAGTTGGTGRGRGGRISTRRAAGSGLAQPHHHAGRSLRARRRNGYLRPALRRQAVAGTGATGRYRQSRGCRRHGRRGDRRQGEAGRLHVSSRIGSPLRCRHRLQATSVRPAEGPRPGDERCVRARRAGDLSRYPGEDASGVHRLLQGQSGQDEFRIRRPGHHPSSSGRDFQRKDGHHHDARPLQRGRAPPRRHSSVAK